MAEDLRRVSKEEGWTTNDLGKLVRTTDLVQVVASITPGTEELDSIPPQLAEIVSEVAQVARALEFEPGLRMEGRGLILEPEQLQEINRRGGSLDKLREAGFLDDSEPATPVLKKLGLITQIAKRAEQGQQR